MDHWFDLPPGIGTTLAVAQRLKGCIQKEVSARSEPGSLVPLNVAWSQRCNVSPWGRSLLSYSGVFDGQCERYVIIIFIIIIIIIIIIIFFFFFFLPSVPSFPRAKNLC